MANTLKMVQVHTIEGLWKQGWSRRRIARELGLDRETVGKYVDQLVLGAQNQPNLTPGNLADLSPSGALSALPEISKPATNSTSGSSGPKSKCEALHEVILAKLELDSSAQRIYQDLVGEQKFCVTATENSTLSTMCHQPVGTKIFLPSALTEERSQPTG